MLPRSRRLLLDENPVRFFTVFSAVFGTPLRSGKGGVTTTGATATPLVTDMTIAIATGIVMPIARTTGVIAAASRPVPSGIARRQSAIRPSQFQGPAAR